MRRCWINRVTVIAAVIAACGPLPWTATKLANADDFAAQAAPQRIGDYSEEGRQRAAEQKRAAIASGFHPKDRVEPTSESAADASALPDAAGPRYSGGVEDFEGAFPGTYWFVGDLDPTSGEDYWDDVSCKSYEGNRSAWCAANGVDPDCSTYDSYMAAYMYVECSYLGLYANGTNKLY